MSNISTTSGFTNNNPKAVVCSESSQLGGRDAVGLEDGAFPNKLPWLSADAVRAEHHGEAGQQTVAFRLLKHRFHEAMLLRVMGSNGSRVGRGLIRVRSACRMPASLVMSA